MGTIELLEKVLDGAQKRDWNVQKLALEGLHIDGAHHKQWYLERILEQVADANTRLLLEDPSWERGV